jgi:Arc/MetJ family transcription regulator
MRTHIMIDDELMSDVLKLTGIKSKREAVEQALRTLLALKQQEK